MSGKRAGKHGWAIALNCWADTLKIDRAILNCSMNWGAIAHLRWQVGQQVTWQGGLAVRVAPGHAHA